jgi:PAS domain S-box-containing protein
VTSDRQPFREDFRELYEDAPCGYLSTRLDGTIVGVNQTFLSWTGHTREELLYSAKLQDLLTTPGKIFYETQFAPLLQMQSSVKEVALELVRKHADPLPVLLNSDRVTALADGSEFIRTIFFDATARRRYERDLLESRRNLEEKVRRRTAELEREVSERGKAERGLRELSSRLLRLQDEERRRIARDLHDSVGQALAAATMSLGAVLREQKNLTPNAAQSLDEAGELIRQSVKEIRVVSYLLHPPLLDESGLPSALRWYLEGFATRGDTQVTLSISDDFGRLPLDLETAIFRIVQECLTNIHRHSGSKAATVHVSRSPTAVRVEVSDRGHGMPPDAPQGVGLRGMRERVAQFAGAITIDSSPRGTTVTAQIPLTPSPE